MNIKYNFSSKTMSRIILVLLFLYFFILPTVNARNDIYIVNDNEILKNDEYKIILTDPIILYEVDWDKIYLTTNENLYIINNFNGNLIYKVHIPEITNISLSDDYIFASNKENVYKINKLTGAIDTKYASENNIIFTYKAPYIELNNTNLAPTSLGHPEGTNERIIGNTYYTNETSIEIFVYLHANSAGQNARMNLSINGVVVHEIGLRPLVSPENTYSSITAIIPANANYSIEAINFHHYEWREYKMHGVFGI